MNKSKKARVIAFYLPQFHPIPENDRWWGKGFTEWTNVGKAKPLFKGHEQPRVPADLGYYDLRLPEVREAQAELAKEAGIEGFCYWHYWFGKGKTLLSEILDDIIASGKPDFPFCIGWANHDWSRKTWDNIKSKKGDELLIKQEYPDDQDIKDHFYNVLPAFKDPRYIKIGQRPIFLVFKPLDIPNSKHFIKIWNELAKQEGLNKIYFIAVENNTYISPKSINLRKADSLIISPQILFNKIFENGYDGINTRGMILAQLKYDGKYMAWLKIYYRALVRRLFKIEPIQKYKYSKISKLLYTEEEKQENIFPTIIPNFDRSPRGGKKAIIWYKNEPESFKKQVSEAIKLVQNRDEDKKIIFLMSWNEWGEGNYMEPDLKYGKQYIYALKDSLL